MAGVDIVSLMHLGLLKQVRKVGFVEAMTVSYGASAAAFVRHPL